MPPAVGCDSFDKGCGSPMWCRSSRSARAYVGLEPCVWGKALRNVSAASTKNRQDRLQDNPTIFMRQSSPSGIIFTAAVCNFALKEQKNHFACYQRNSSSLKAFLFKVELNPLWKQFYVKYLGNQTNLHKKYNLQINVKTARLVTNLDNLLAKKKRFRCSKWVTKLL